MAKYHHSPVAELAHQLKLSPVRLRLRQLDAIEYLIDLVEPKKSYPYDFVCHQITGYRPKAGTSQRSLLGRTLIEDLVQMTEDLSAVHVLPAGLIRPCWTTEELASRLKVSTKTICRWRQRGLPGRKLRYPDGTIRMAFTERGVRRFVVRHHDLVKRGAAFKQLSAAEKQRIVDLARQTLSKRRMRLHELSQLVAAEVGRAVETVRYTLRRYDQSHPQEALFGSDDQPVVKPELQAIYDAVEAGRSVAAVARLVDKSAAEVRDIVREVRCRHLKASEITCVYSPEFEAPGADETILGSNGNDEDRVQPKRVRPPKDLPPYLQDLYRQPLFSPEQERTMFRRYNYLKFKAEKLRKRLEPLEATDAHIEDLERMLARSDEVKNEILRANLRLVVSIARRHVGRSACFFEIVSDGNLALMRAVEKFDYTRGFKFSTYASWAIMRNYARTIPEQLYETGKLVTSSDELLAQAPAPDTDHDLELEGARHLVAKGLALLSDRERDVVERHYGLGKAKSPMTLDQIGQVFGVTKERVRQIERKALAKLRDGLQSAEEELAPA